ncbi:MAG TPA: EamA family transporter [Candidatus Cybelea sp.]|nr:EamA family transporter [Candidatus Cybelea sp.]
MAERSRAAPRPAIGATLVGGGAILLWATLAALTTSARGVPTFLLAALAFSIGFSLAAAKWAALGESPFERLRLPARVWAVGILGLGGYHVLYFLALRLAPPVEANLINYLWPLLIVLFSALLPGERLRWFHVAGGAAGLVGAAVLIASGGIAVEGHAALGYVAALGCALTWSAYSVLSRRFASVPSDAVGGFCGATAIICWAAHAAFEPAVWPSGAEWYAVLALGCGPVGAAFYLWDWGVKQGDIRALGTAAYATPLLSTLLLIVIGVARPTSFLALATLLIVGGAALGSGDLWRGRAGG